MFTEEQYITITGLNYYYNMKPFKIGAFVILHKEPSNVYDCEAIAVLAPLLGKVGYVANSPHTIVSGTMSAGRLYDKIPDECAAIVRFITSTRVVARVLPDKKLRVNVDVELEAVSDTVYSPGTIEL